jgi:hypothetical protein
MDANPQKKAGGCVWPLFYCTITTRRGATGAAWWTFIFKLLNCVLSLRRDFVWAPCMDFAARDGLVHVQTCGNTASSARVICIARRAGQITGHRVKRGLVRTHTQNTGHAWPPCCSAVEAAQTALPCCVPGGAGGVGAERGIREFTLSGVWLNFPFIKRGHFKCGPETNIQARNTTNQEKYSLYIISINQLNR